MTKLEALPFDPERWPELQAEGWRFSVGKEELHFVGLMSDGRVVFEKDGRVYSVADDNYWMLPPPVVIEFKVGLFKDGEPIRILNDVIGPTEDNVFFVRLLTPDERAKGEVRVEE